MIGNHLANSIDKSYELIDIIDEYYTTDILSQAEDSEEETVIFTIDDHNFVEGDRLRITDVSGADDYNDTFEVILLDGNEVTVSLEYVDNADLSNATISSLSIFDNLTVQLSNDDFCAIIVETDDTKVRPTASGEPIPQGTFYPILVIDNIADFPRETRIKDCRRYISAKLYEILGLLKCKIIGNKIARTETVWNGKKVSIVSATIEY